jgi:hypothetical protein
VYGMVRLIDFEVPAGFCWLNIHSFCCILWEPTVSIRSREARILLPSQEDLSRELPCELIGFIILNVNRNKCEETYSNFGGPKLSQWGFFCDFKPFFCVLTLLLGL